jgi:hypothetical protein
MKVHESLLLPHQLSRMFKLTFSIKGARKWLNSAPQAAERQVLIVFWYAALPHPRWAASVLEVLAPRTETCVGRFHVQCAADCSKLLFSDNIRNKEKTNLCGWNLLLDAVAAWTSRCKRHIAVFWKQKGISVASKTALAQILFLLMTSCGPLRYLLSKRIQRAAIDATRFGITELGRVHLDRVRLAPDKEDGFRVRLLVWLCLVYQ